MKTGTVRRLIALSVAGLTSCGSSSPAPTAEEFAQTNRKLAEYRQRYGPLNTPNPKFNFRELQKSLPGKSRREVKAYMGKPAGVYVSGSSECWDYDGVSYAPYAGRTVSKLEVWFENGKVERLDAVF